MLTFLTSKIGRWLAIAGAAIVTILAFIGMVKRGARDEMELEQRRETDRKVNQARETARDTRKRISDVDSDQLDSELRDRGL